jgi:hypothetical protein
MHPVIKEIARRVEEQARAAGTEMSDMVFLARAEAQALMKQCDVDATFLDDNKVDEFLAWAATACMTVLASLLQCLNSLYQFVELNASTACCRPSKPGMPRWLCQT